MPNVPYDEDSRTANLCVLLHGALKTSTLCALVQVAANGSRNWFGILFSHADSKKKFCLMLALFEPGNEPVPWLGNLLRLGPLDDLNATSQEPFPVKLLGKCFLNSIFRLFPIISISQKFFTIFFLTLEKIGIDEKVICYHNISN